MNHMRQRLVIQRCHNVQVLVVRAIALRVIVVADLYDVGV